MIDVLPIVSPTLSSVRNEVPVPVTVLLVTEIVPVPRVKVELAVHKYNARSVEVDKIIDCLLVQVLALEVNPSVDFDWSVKFLLIIQLR